MRREARHEWGKRSKGIDDDGDDDDDDDDDDDSCLRRSNKL